MDFGPAKSIDQDYEGLKSSLDLTHLDKTPPTLTSISTTSSRVGTGFLGIGDEYIITLNSLESLKEPIVFISGKKAVVQGEAQNWTAKMSVRNRIFTGYSWEENLFGFKDALDEDLLDLITTNQDKVGMQHQIDRLFVQWEKRNWNVRLGRQRINWGIQNYWNSHDLFNQINFFDFDYLERPGNNALRIQYYGTGTSSKELAINYAKKKKIEYEIIEPRKRKTVKKSYADNFLK